jgi:hypothetical protein
MSPLLPSAAGSPLAMGYPVMNAQLSEQIATGATVFPSEGRVPQAIPRSGPRNIDPGGSMPLEHSDAQRAAALMSPVGEHYPGQVDWSAAAAAKARAVPPWLLAVLFIGAIGVALAFTIVIARLVR